MARNMDGGIQWQNAQDWLYYTGTYLLFETLHN